MTLLLSDGSNPRGRVRKWARELVENLDVVSLPDVTEEVVKRIGDDREVMRALLYEGVYEEVATVAQSTRGLHRYGEEYISDEKLETQAKKFASRWEKWLEHSNGRHIRLMVMKKEDLLAAADSRRKRARSEIEIAELWESIAAKLDENQTVGDVFTPEQIEAMVQTARIVVPASETTDAKFAQ